MIFMRRNRSLELQIFLHTFERNSVDEFTRAEDLSQLRLGCHEGFEHIIIRVEAQEGEIDSLGLRWTVDGELDGRLPVITQHKTV